MVNIEKKELKTDVAVRIANKLLEVFKYSCDSAGIILVSYPCYDEIINEEQEEQYFYEIIDISDRKSGCCLKKMEKENESDLYEKHGTYYIHYKTREYQIKFYESPENCGYCEPVQYNRETDMFCNIKSLNAKGETVYEMDFTFNIETMSFLELYALTSQYMKIKEGKILINKYTGQLEKSKILILKDGYNTTLIKKLENRILADIHKFDDSSKTE